MSDLVQPMASVCAAIVETIGVTMITGIAILVVVRGAVRWIRKEDHAQIINEVRQRLGKGILLGLEFLIAADIIHTVAVDLTIESIGVLAVVVLIRTFLSFTLEMELHGRWPWQAAPSGADSAR